MGVVHGRIQGLLSFWVTPIISETGEATNVKFCMHIHRIDRIIGAKVH